MEQEDADLLAQRLNRKEGFALDREDTVLYGICAECRKEQ
jgi:Fe2+ or Zn2+ uptake regulation protein